MSSEKSGDSLRGSTAPAAARRRRPAPAGALSYYPGPGLRGAHAHGSGRHAATGRLRSPWLPLTAAALHCLRASLPGGHALCRRNPGGNGSNLHTPPATPGPGPGPSGAKAPAARLHAHRSADHHLLLLAYGHHCHLQGSAGTHGLGPRRHGVSRDRFTRGPELLLHLPGRGHSSHGAVYHPHRSHHHRCAAPRELLGSVRMPPAQPHPAPLDLPSAFYRQAADPMGALRTRFWGHRTSLHPKLGLHGNSRLVSTLRIQFLRNLAKTHTNRDTASRDPCQILGPQSLQAPTPSKCSTPSRAPWVTAPQPGDWSLKPRLLHRLRPSSDKTPPPGRQAPPSFFPCGVIQSGDWVCGARPRPQTDRLLPFSWRKSRTRG
ncbi:proline-rich transmembrane protein 1 isoform X2 [Camelus ferus]|uniref:Proline-rich transmembrane protein 1 isoform X2 n=1 Tax=Camelus ferus TaxID=419612 RepID=A0A8B6YAI3_CAMFR|nr:proline-rich transmembrane protein 1 isoform X2 [Camelus ferus]